jgi:[acyl-carrier-protein] S-malonyltransferase/trans-AT polyketide synthase/acyltransferase/oxidoreductase domain-containing protein
MADEFAAAFPAAQRVLAEASDALGLDVLALTRATDGQLDQTENTQPAIVATEIAMLEALRENFSFAPSRFGGHSLGEYTALVAAGAIPLASALRLVRLRGRLMQTAVPIGVGGMVAIIQNGLDLERVRVVAAAADVDVANINSPSQVVLSGGLPGLASAIAALEPWLASGGGRAVRLEVSAPFHSRALGVVEPDFHSALLAEAAAFHPECARAVTSNYLGGFHDGTLAGLVDALVHQISGSVRWTEDMRVLAADGARIVEIGPNRPLSRFFKELGIDSIAVLNVKAAEKAFARA